MYANLSSGIVMTISASWNRPYSREIDASPQTVWKALADISNWKLWNAGVKSIQINGNFITGSHFSMELADGEVINSELIDVSAPRHFIDETWVGETVIRVEHRIEVVSGDRCRVVYAVSAEGPEAQIIGEAVSADFPEVLAGLATYVTGRAAE